MIIDTDILIWYLRGNEKAFKLIKKNNAFSISVITYMELIQGMRNKKELQLFQKKLKEWNVNIIYINEEISIKALFYIERHYLSCSMEIADALIAATAAVNNMVLCSGNIKHFKIIKEIKTHKFAN